MKQAVPLLAGLVLALFASGSPAQGVKTQAQLLSELKTPAGDEEEGSLLSKKRFAASYRPDSSTGRCAGSEQSNGTSGMPRKDLAVVPLAAAEPVSSNVPFQFEFDQHRLTAQDERQANELAQTLNHASLSGRRFSISGHTDAKGPREHNLRLSCARALAVRDALVTRGVDDRRLGVFGFGSDRLAHANQPFDARNRRVEVQNVDAFEP